jgi:cytochrome b6-f complex iron-sulfur subunit
MAEKKKMSVAEILAAARKVDGKADADSTAGTSSASLAEVDVATAEAAAKKSPQATTSGQSNKAGQVKPVPKSGTGRPSVAEMLAMARGEKSDGEKTAPQAVQARTEPPPPKPTAKSGGAKPVLAEKTAVAAKTKPQNSPLDTQSILAAARKQHKPGPVSKALAATLAKPSPAAEKKTKEEVIIPPMPVKPAYAKPSPKSAEAAERRSFLFGLSALAVGFVSLTATSAIWTLGTVRFMFPNILREPPSKFRVGFPDQFPPGQVQEKFKAQFGIWIVNTEYNGEPQIVALKSVCTHLGCTPNWLEAEQKFKCPCHGSGFYKDGINFEGPAPRPLERYAISIADDGQIEVDKSRTFQEEMGQWSDPSSFVPV